MVKGLNGNMEKLQILVVNTSTSTMLTNFDGQWPGSHWIYAADEQPGDRTTLIPNGTNMVCS